MVSRLPYSTNEVCIMRECNQDPLSLVANHQMTPLDFNTYQSSYNNPQFQQQFSPSQSPQYGSIHPTQHYLTTYPSTPHSINYPSTTAHSSFMLLQSTIHQDANPQPQFIPQIKYIISTVNQQTHLAEFPQIDSGLAVSVFKQGDDPIDAINKMISFLSQRVVKVVLKLLREGLARQCLKPKRKRDATWFRDKVLLVEAQGSGKVLNEEELEFLVDPGVAEAKAVLMANLSNYGSDFLSEVPYSENTHIDMLNQSVQEILYSEQPHLMNYPENKITSDSNIISYSQYLLETQNAAVQDINSFVKQDAMILSVFETTI
ncbi:hypothetical protein Tco_1155826 [Tanacetum coccineum]